MKDRLCNHTYQFPDPGLAAAIQVEARAQSLHLCKVPPPQSPLVFQVISDDTAVAGRRRSGYGVRGLKAKFVKASNSLQKCFKLYNLSATPDDLYIQILSVSMTFSPHHLDF